MSEHLYPCRIRTDPLAICDCKTNHMTPTASDSDEMDDIPACPYCGAMAGVCPSYPECPSGPGWSKEHTTPTMTALEKSHEQFEKEFKNWDLRSLEDGLYLDQRTRCAFCGWNAAWNRRAAAPAQAAQRVETARLCKGCGKPILIANGLMDDGCPCNTTRGVNVKPTPCTICGIEDCVKPAHHTRDCWVTSPQQGKIEQGEAFPVAACCGRRECGGECGNEWRGMESAPQPTAEGSCFRRAIDLARKTDELSCSHKHSDEVCDWIEKKAAELAGDGK